MADSTARGRVVPGLAVEYGAQRGFEGYCGLGVRAGGPPGHKAIRAHQQGAIRTNAVGRGTLAAVEVYAESMGMQWDAELPPDRLRGGDPCRTTFPCSGQQNPPLSIQVKGGPVRALQCDRQMRRSRARMAGQLPRRQGRGTIVWCAEHGRRAIAVAKDQRPVIQERFSGASTAGSNTGLPASQRLLHGEQARVCEKSV